MSKGLSFPDNFMDIFGFKRVKEDEMGTDNTVIKNDSCEMHIAQAAVCIAERADEIITKHVQDCLKKE